ncbi:hypothetical protein [Pendulispora albinea]|uniref:Uncharacterized protein n=1 Tax=Pendulispora albinea TaxID=2741071 RepID=A0ABZ2M828_9BACT
MVIGLLVALSLSGALWFLIGIGQAIVFRDRGQEAADSVALSSATIHARGMNTIAAINIISLALVAFYLILSLIGDILLLLAIVAAIIPGGQAAALQLAKAATTPYKMAVKYEKTALKTALPMLGLASSTVAVTAPWLGTAAAGEAARRYSDQKDSFMGVAIGPSNFNGIFYKENEPNKPSDAKSRGGVLGFLDKGEHKVLGLPVSREKNQALCVRAIGYPIILLTNWLRSVIPIPMVGAWIAQVVETVAIAPAWIHCGGELKELVPKKVLPNVEFVAGKLDGAVKTLRKLGVTIDIPLGDRDLWREQGPKEMAFANGDTHFVVLGWALGGDFRDTSIRRVQLASQQYGGGVEDSVHAYDAQAEFFYDCGETWSKPSCNGPSSIGITATGYQHALYSIRWKARLKRSMNPLEVLARVGLEKGLEYFTGKGFREAHAKTANAPLLDAAVRYFADMVKAILKERSQTAGRIPTGNYH